MEDELHGINPVVFNRIALQHPRAIAQVFTSVILPDVLGKKQLPFLKRAIHIGSTALGIFDRKPGKKSDIDIIAVFDDAADATKIMTRSRTEIAALAQRHHMPRAIHLTCVREEDLANPRFPSDKKFIDAINRDGRALRMPKK